jgi:hypothetical protein
MTLAQWLDVVILVLLIAACGAAAVIVRRLVALQQAQRHLFDAIAQFDAASRRAEETLRKIEATGAVRSASLAKTTEKAQELLDDLAMMSVSGERIAERIEAAVWEVKTIGGGRAGGAGKRAA